MAPILQSVHNVTGKTLKDVRSDVIEQSGTCRSWMRALVVFLLFGLIGSLIACKYVFEDQLRSPMYTKRVTGYSNCAAIREDFRPVCFCDNATTSYNKYASLGIERSWCESYQSQLSSSITLTDLNRQIYTKELVTLCEFVTDTLTQRIDLLQFYSPTLRTRSDLEADLKRLAAGAYFDVVQSVALQKLLSILEFNSSISANGLSPRLAAQNPANGQLIISDINEKQQQGLLVIQEDMKNQVMINTLLTNLHVDYDSYHRYCHPNECTYSTQKTLYVLIVEFLGALGGLIQVGLGLGSLILWPLIMCCCHWKSGDRAWDPEQDQADIPSAQHSRSKTGKGGYY